MATTEDGWLGYAEAADYLTTSLSTLKRAVAANRIPYVRDPLTGRVRFRRSALDAWMTERGKRAGR